MMGQRRVLDTSANPTNPEVIESPSELHSAFATFLAPVKARSLGSSLYCYDQLPHALSSSYICRTQDQVQIFQIFERDSTHSSICTIFSVSRPPSV